MTTASDPLQPMPPNPSGPTPIVAELAAATNTFWQRFDLLLDGLSDRLNPILVKESRQAMKSRQFTITFTLLLIVGWVYTLLFVLVNLPGVFYSPLGRFMLFGYYLILAVPLLIVVPYGAFRSLASELEDGTFELLSITALHSRQIILGKLGSSVLQMLVYYSALAPCIAFTYLLRGVDVMTIFFILLYSFYATLLLSVVSLALATVTRSRQWQVLLSVLLVVALVLFAFFWCMGMSAILSAGSSMPYDEPEWWMINVAIFMFEIALVILFVFIAAGQISFASENRSTSIRIMLLVLQSLIFGWTIYPFLVYGEEPILMIGAIWLALFWAVAGAFLIGEMAQLSPRARRELPQSLVGRMAFTWFNPGSGTGYVFAILNVLGGLGIMAITGYAHASANSGGPNILQPAFWYEFLGWCYALVTFQLGIPPFAKWTAWWLALLCYLTIYLGLARLFGVLLRWGRMGGGMLSVFIFYLLLVVGGVALPFALQGVMQAMFRYGYSALEYSPLQISNWWWTLIEIGLWRGTVNDGTIWLLIVVAAAVFLLNFILAAKDVEQTRLAAPTRVIEDELALHPPPAKPVKRSPWDEPPPAGPQGDSPFKSNS
ncbi:hypothetical protein [Anatilimnocola floriformis]|uniref:hypothetical protein n=1 Tax=Anatilimnocola floriformis TaxID=2948575 RepID=UPI0020C32200|nr:hypothetical protein [Anatilimnocola floriformis]